MVSSKQELKYKETGRNKIVSKKAILRLVKGRTKGLWRTPVE
ncbi:hypothetical protein [Absiella sp. AM29-15]|nr:hypothetical protein [Absiella sp. AM29-15]